MKIHELILLSFKAGAGSSLVGHFCGAGAGVGFFFGLISYPVAELTSTLSRPSHFTIGPSGRIEESTLDLVRSVILPMFLGQIAAWATLTIVGFPLSFVSCLVLTAGSLAWDIFMDSYKDCVRKAFGYGPDVPMSF